MLKSERLSVAVAEIVSGGKPWLLAGLLIAMAPALHTLATWDLDGRLSPQAFAVRHYSYVIMLIELCVIWLAVRNDLSIKKAISGLPLSISVLLGAWLALAIMALFSSAIELANATFILARYAIHGFFLMALIHLVRKANDFEMRRWLVILSVGAVIYVLLLAFFCFLVPDPYSFPWVVRVPSATNIRQIGNNVGLLAIAPIAILLTAGRTSQLKYIAALIIIMAFTSWTGSRATLLGLVVGVGGGILFVKHLTTARKIVITSLIACVGVLTSVIFPTPNSYFGIIRMYKAISEHDDPSTGRWQLWADTWQQILESPWIGHGAGRFRNEMNILYGTEVNHPHNFILQYVYDWGILGGGVAVLLLAMLGIEIWRARQAEVDVRFSALSAFGAICTTAIVDSPLFHPLPIVIALTLIAPVFSKQKLQYCR